MKKLLLTVLFGVALTGCSKEQDKPADAVLVTVGKTSISDRALDVFLRSTISEDAYFAADEGFKKNALESLVQTRAMAVVEEETLNADDLADLESKVAFYRDKLLATQYLNKHLKKEPISLDKLKDYYDRNQDQFREEGKKKFRAITSVGRLTDGQRQDVVKAFEAAAPGQDLQALVQKLVADGLPVRYQTADMKPSLLPEPLKGLVNKLGQNQAGKHLRGQILAYAVVDEEVSGVQKPFAAVVEEVRTRMAPVYMKDAVAEVVKVAIGKVAVEYKNREN